MTPREGGSQQVALWELLLLFLALLVAGGLIWMSRKRLTGEFKYRRDRGASRRKSLQSILQETAIEAAEEVIPPSPPKADHPKEQTAAKKSELPEIPWSYGDTRIIALARDPYWLFAYWEISETTKDRVERRYGPHAWEEARPVLRVYDATNLYFFESRQVMEIQINDFANNWYINTGQPNHTYLVELGRMLPDGTYIFIARSNLVTTPRNDFSEIVDLEWLMPSEYEKRIYRRFAGAGPGSPGFVQEMAQKAVVIKEEEYISSPLNW